MRICQVAPCFPYQEYLDGISVEKKYHVGGVERHILELSKALVKRGNSVTIFTTRAPFHRQYHEIDSFDIIRIPYGLKLYSSSIPFNLFKYFNIQDYDVIHAHTPNPMMADLACLKNNGEKPFILTYHNEITKGGLIGKTISSIYNKTFGYSLLKKSDLILTTTKDYAEESINLKKFRNKIKIVPNGVDVSRFSPTTDGKPIRKKYNIPKNSKVLLFIGALEQYKGIEYLLAAFKKVISYTNDIYLIIVGKGSLLEKLKSKVIQLGLSNNVIFAGYVKDIDLPFYYAFCDVFILPSVSKKEGFGIVQLEAMASGKPVISTNLPGVLEVDKDEVASLHVPPMDAEVLANAIIKLVLDSELLRELGRKGRFLVEERYIWDKIAGDIEKVYYEVA
ncbi:MAG TPA: glycosyltransferase family 1 protein [Proteobacteria bacterium]|nr:glycosyltransferase family 1 protein [Pseudomonadota bacterium]